MRKHRGSVVIALAFVLLSPVWPATADEGTGQPAAVATAARVNVNTASVQELMTLAGVDRALAQKIVAHREKRGRFKRAGDVRKVDGFGDALWKQNRARIAVK